MATVTFAGSPVGGEIATVTVSGNGSQTFRYVATKTDTPTTIAAAIANQINVAGGQDIYQPKAGPSAAAGALSIWGAFLQGVTATATAPLTVTTGP